MSSNLKVQEGLLAYGVYSFAEARYRRVGGGR
jgi:hypothetical protein